MKKIDRVNLKEFIEKTNGKLFAVIFTKKDGTKRKMVARLGVKKNLKGGFNSLEGKSKPYKTVYDVQAKGYRAVNLKTTEEVHVNGEIWKVV